MKHIPCNLCGADAPALMFETGDGRRIHRCADCGFVYATPVPDDTELMESHEEGYYEKIGGYETLLEKKTREWRELFAALARHVPPGPLLEVGCARGWCGALARSLGWQPVGVDISKKDIEFAKKKHGIEVVHGTLTDAHFEADRFSAAIMWSVIEHLSNPREVLAEAHRVLAPGGVISVSTCNMESRAAREDGENWLYYVLPGHLCFFSPATLRRMLESTGFEVIEFSGGVEFKLAGMNAVKNAVKGALGKILPPAAMARVKSAAVKAAASGAGADAQAGENFIMFAKKT
jgi:ubiquinone/menaquinone biosynthesis C-methylase UbiE